MDDRYELGAEATTTRIRLEQGSPITERDWNSYPYIFDLPAGDEEYWRGKKVLDVGSGIKWRNPNVTFPGAMLCAIDPEFEAPLVHNSFTGIPKHENNAHEKRIGVVQEIPYDDNTFDHVISSHAMPQHVYPIDHAKAVSEMLRVVRPAGDVRMAPCVKLDLPMKELIEAGFDVDFSHPTTEGILVIIRFADIVRRQTDPVMMLWQKAEAWKKFHEKAIPKDSIMVDFNTMDYARSQAK